MYQFTKRLIDIAFSAIFLILFFPSFILITFGIMIFSGLPILFIPKMVGLNGAVFSMPKFRTMAKNSSTLNIQYDPECDLRKLQHDPRITLLGRFLRKFSLDELPQLWSVLKGDMSLVGPRPHSKREREYYSKNDEKRLSVKPGLTCTWQINGRANISFRDQIKMDLEYIEKKSLLIDLTILCKTIPAVLFAKGAY